MSIDIKKFKSGKFGAEVRYRKVKYYIGTFGSEEAARAAAHLENDALLDGTSPLFDPVYTHSFEMFAREIGVARGTVRRWATEGMPSKRLVGQVVRVNPEEAKAWVATNRSRSISFHRRACVYIVERDNDGAVKIGWTSDVQRRLVELRKKGGFDISLIGCAPADKPIELSLHAHFADKAIGGEWFEISANDAFRELLKRVS